MRCPSCGSEVDPRDFPNHFALCQAVKSEPRGNPGRRPRPITAREAEIRAQSLAPSSSLLLVLATRTAVYAVHGENRLIQVAEEWRLVYQKPGSGWKAVDVNAHEVKVCSESGAVPPDVTEYPPLNAWQLDSDEALRLAESFGGHIQAGGMMGGPGLFQLRMCDVDDASVPLWWVPHRMEWYPFYIRADTGAPAFIKDDERFLFTLTPPPDLRDHIGIERRRTRSHFIPFRDAKLVAPSSPMLVAPATASQDYHSPDPTKPVQASSLTEGRPATKPSRAPVALVILLALGAIGVFVHNNYFAEQSRPQPSSARVTPASAGRPGAQSGESKISASSSKAARTAQPVPADNRHGESRHALTDEGADRPVSIGSVTVGGFATQGIDVAPMGSSSLEYVVKISFSNGDSGPLVFDTIRIMFFSEVGGGQGMKTVKTDGGLWQLFHGEEKDFSFHTDGYTGQILQRAGGSPILFAAKLLLGGQTVAGTFLAELPALRYLPSEYAPSGRGYPLQFKTVEISEF